MAKAPALIGMDGAVIGIVAAAMIANPGVTLDGTIGIMATVITMNNETVHAKDSTGSSMRLLESARTPTVATLIPTANCLKSCVIPGGSEASTTCASCHGRSACLSLSTRLISPLAAAP